jgi:hypothetical protein
MLPGDEFAQPPRPGVTTRPFTATTDPFRPASPHLRPTVAAHPHLLATPSPRRFSSISQRTMNYILRPGAGRDAFVRFWRLVAQAVARHPSAFGAELMNEPASIHRRYMFETWRAAAEAIHATVPDMSVAVADTLNAYMYASRADHTTSSAPTAPHTSQHTAHHTVHPAACLTSAARITRAAHTASAAHASRTITLPPTSHLPPPTSHLPPPTSHLPPPTSHLPPPTSQLTLVVHGPLAGTLHVWHLREHTAVAA